MEVQGLKRMVDQREALRNRRLGYRNEGKEDPKVCSVACLRHTWTWDYWNEHWAEDGGCRQTEVLGVMIEAHPERGPEASDPQRQHGLGPVMLFGLRPLHQHFVISKVRLNCHHGQLWKEKWIQKMIEKHSPWHHGSGEEILLPEWGMEMRLGLVFSLVASTTTSSTHSPGR